MPNSHLSVNYVRLSLLRIIATTILLSCSLANADEISQRNEIISQARNAFNTGDFKLLENLSKKYITIDKRTDSGAQKINLFYDGIGSAITGPNGASEEHIKKALSLTSQWATENPKSALPIILHAEALIKYAFYFRGQGVASTVSEVGWEKFRGFISTADKFLVANKALASQDSSWYVKMLLVKNMSSAAPSEIDAIAAEGLKINPEDDRIYYLRLNSLLPKWGGSALKIDKFINQVAATNPNNRGSELYARLYSSAEQSQFQDRIFKESNIEWEKMKLGLEMWNQKYPTSWNKNIYAYFSCIANDKATSRKVVKEISTNLILSVWGSKGAEIYSWCSKWIDEK